MGDLYRPLRLLAGEALAAISIFTPKLDTLVSDLSKLSARTSITHWRHKLNTDLNLADSLLYNESSFLSTATAHILTGVSQFP